MKSLGNLLFKILLFSTMPIIADAARYSFLEPKRIILMTSLDTSEGVWYNSTKVLDRLESMEKTFRKTLSFLIGPHSTFQLEMVFNATQKDLWEALNDKNVYGLLWVSHMGYDGKNAVVRDRSGFDVLPVFKEVTSQKKFIGLIGCYSRQIAELVRQGLMINGEVQAHGDLLRVYGSSSEAISDWEKEFGLVLRQFTGWVAGYLLRGSQVEELYPTAGDQISVTRKIPLHSGKTYKSVRLEHQGRVVGVFDAALPGEEQTIQITLRASLDYPIVTTTGHYTDGKINSDVIGMGDIEFTPLWPEPQIKWQLATFPNGQPIGVTLNTFKAIKW